MSESIPSLFQLDECVTLLPVVHGSGDFAMHVRRLMLQNRFDALAVPLPESFSQPVTEAVAELPTIQVCARKEPSEKDAYQFVPIDPCQPVIMALRMATQEYIPAYCIDQEAPVFEPESLLTPDPYSVKIGSLERFCASMLPAIPPLPANSQPAARVQTMAARLRAIAARHERVFCLCSLAHWPWLRDAYQTGLPEPDEEDTYHPVFTAPVREASLLFVSGELPYFTYLYEKARRELLPDENLSIDGIKQLLLETRRQWLEQDRPLHNWATPQRLQVLLQYIRNLTLMHARLTPDLYTMTLAAKQVIGDTFAIRLVETAKQYPFQHVGSDTAAFGINEAQFPHGDAGPVKNRLEGMPVVWRNIALRKQPNPAKQKQWRQTWNPYGICSWPPEDERIENLNTHVREIARSMISEDLAKSEKFTTSFKDGLDLRESIRHWYTGDLYVKELPPARGQIETVVFLFDTPADHEKYSWRTTWYAEHDQESTLSFYATPIGQNFIGPGIAQCTYGGCLFIYPPKWVPNIWEDPRLRAYTNLEERLIAGACLHSSQKIVVVVSPYAPPPAWRYIARRWKRKLLHISSSRFSLSMQDRLRIFHVLNGKHIRSYAAKFIREI